MIDISPLKQEIAAFERELPMLLAHHKEKWVVYRDGVLFGSFDTFDNAANAAVAKFGLGPYLIRQVLSEQPKFVLPASVAFRPAHAIA